MKQRKISGMSPTAVGILIKEMMKRGMWEITKQMAEHEVKIKENKYKEGIDFLTSADLAAQKAIIKVVEECFSTAGVIAEESGLRKKPKDREKLWFTIDPLDGTKAFVREQSNGIGSMLALVKDKEIISACIGDVMTGEIYYFRPDSNRVHRLSEFRHRLLEYKKPTELRLLLRDHPLVYSKLVNQWCQPKGGVFTSIEIANGSIGLSFAKLWKREVQALVLHAGVNMPWDWIPVVGLSQKLGYLFFVVKDQELKLVPDSKLWGLGNIQFDSEVLVIHKKDLKALKHG